MEQLFKQLAISFCCHSEKYLKENTIELRGGLAWSSLIPVGLTCGEVFHLNSTAALCVSKIDNRIFHPAESIFMLYLEFFCFCKKLLDFRHKVVYHHGIQ